MISSRRAFPTGLCSAGRSSRDVCGKHWTKESIHVLVFGVNSQAFGATVASMVLQCLQNSTVPRFIWRFVIPGVSAKGAGWEIGER